MVSFVIPKPDKKLRPETNETAFTTVPVATGQAAAGVTDRVWTKEDFRARMERGASDSN